MQKYKKQSNNELKQKLNPNIKSSGSLIQFFMKSKSLKNIQMSFHQIFQYSDKKAKSYTSFMKIMNKIAFRKHASNKKCVFGSLLHNKIQYQLSKMQKIRTLKEKSKKQSTKLISHILSKSLKLKMIQTFNQMRAKSSLIFKRKAFKIAKIVNQLKSVQRKIILESFLQIKWSQYKLMSKYKRCYIIERILKNKRTQHLTQSFKKIQINPQIKSSKQEQTLKNKIIPNFEDTYNEDQIVKELQQKRKVLQSQLNSKRAANRTTIKQRQAQATKIEEQYESLKFSSELMGEQNEQLKQSIEERQNHALNAETRHIKNEVNLTSASRLSQQQLWRSVFNNLLLYLYQLKKSQEQVNRVQIEKQGKNRSQPTLDTLINKIIQPLMNNFYFRNVQELREQNQVLKQLLAAYKQMFKDRTNHIGTRHLSVQSLNRERRGLYQVVECLAKWGSSDSSQLESLKRAIQKIGNQVKIN